MKKIIFILPYISILFSFYSCKKNDVVLNKINSEPEFKLKILNDTIHKNDSIEIEFSANYPSFFYIRSNQLNDFYNSNKTSINDNKLMVLYHTDEDLVINDQNLSLINENVETMFNYNENCDVNKIEFILEKKSLSKKIKLPIPNEINTQEFKNSKVYISIQYVSILDLAMKCSSEKFKNKVSLEKLNIFTGKLESNAVYFNYINEIN